MGQAAWKRGEVNQLNAMLKRLAYVSPKNSRTGAEGAGAEISEIAKLEAGRHLIKIQPRANDHQMFREALCRNGPIQGEWYLEVKHFPYLSPELAMKIFADQAESHLRRCKLRVSEPLELFICDIGV